MVKESTGPSLWVTRGLGRSMMPVIGSPRLVRDGRRSHLVIAVGHPLSIRRAIRDSPGLWSRGNWCVMIDEESTFGSIHDAGPAATVGLARARLFASAAGKVCRWGCRISLVRKPLRPKVPRCPQCLFPPYLAKRFSNSLSVVEDSPRYRTFSTKGSGGRQKY